MKFALPFCLVLLLSSCGHNMLLKHNKLYYLELNSRREGSPLVLDNSISYDHPNIIDEESWDDLSITFTDSTAAVKQKHLNLATDTALVKCVHHTHSIWHWGKQIEITRGSITVLSWKAQAVKLRLNLHGYNPQLKYKIYYRGTRTFEGELTTDDCYPKYLVSQMLHGHSVSVACLQKYGVLKSEHAYPDDATVNFDGMQQLNDDVFYAIVSVPDTYKICSHNYLITINRKTNKGIACMYLYPDCDIDFSMPQYNLHEHIFLLNGVKVTRTTYYQKPRPDVEDEEDNGKQAVNEDDNMERTEEHHTRYVISANGQIKVWEDD